MFVDGTKEDWWLEEGGGGGIHAEVVLGRGGA